MKILGEEYHDEVKRQVEDDCNKEKENIIAMRGIIVILMRQRDENNTITKEILDKEKSITTRSIE